MILREEKKCVFLEGKSVNFLIEIQISRFSLHWPIRAVRFNLIREISAWKITDAIAAGYCFSACFLAGPLLNVVYEILPQHKHNNCLQNGITGIVSLKVKYFRIVTISEPRAIWNIVEYVLYNIQKFDDTYYL